MRVWKMRLREIREANGHKQFTISQELKIARGTYACWEVEQDMIPLKRLNDFCNLCNVSIDYALELTDIKIYKNSKKKININKSKERIKEIRKINKHTQEDLAKEFDIDRSLISKYEKGISLISTNYLINFSNKYNISCDYLLGKTDEKIELKIKVNSK